MTHTPPEGHTGRMRQRFVVQFQPLPNGPWRDCDQQHIFEDSAWHEAKGHQVPTRVKRICWETLDVPSWVR